MKKSLLVLAVLAALSMVFVSCGGGDNGSTPTPEAETPTEVVVFDPAVLSAAPDGTEIVENDGVKYLKVTVDGYNTVVEVPEINLKGKTTFTTTVYADAANDGLKLTVKLADANNADIATPDITPLSTTPTVITATYATKTDWNTVSESGKCVKIQPMVQDTTAWAAQSGVVIYIGKIIAK